VKAVVATAGGYSIGGTFQRFMGVEGFARFREQVNERVMEEYRTGKVQYIPTISRWISAEVPMAVMPIEEAYSYMIVLISQTPQTGPRRRRCHPLNPISSTTPSSTPLS
jgi:uncharacterized membrane protein